MLRKTLNLCRNTGRGGLGSALALALVLAGGGFVGSAVLHSPAQAQNSKAFVKAYQPVAALVGEEGGDAAAARAQLPAVLAAVETDDDRSAAGNLALQIGTKLEDQALQRQGLELMLASGKVPAEQVGQLQYFVGAFAYEARDWPAARTALEAAIAAGYTKDNPEGLLAEIHFSEGRHVQGLDYLRGVIEQRVAAGQAVPDTWFRRGLQVAYEQRLADPAVEWSALHVAHSPSDKRWVEALQVVNAISVDDRQSRLDLLRLMALTNSLSERSEYIAYIEAADPRIMANEVDRVLDAAVQAGVLTTAEEYYADVKRTVDDRAPADRAGAPQLAAEARQSGQARDAQNAGDVFLSLGSYAEAEQMFKLALEKPGVDRDQALTRLGIAQVHQGKHAEAKATFRQVSGARTAVARMWSAYADSRA